MSTTIEYPILNAEEREIRVLTFVKDDRGQILGHFSVVSLNQPVHYIALSYLWGTESPDCQIWIDGRPFWVRPGLFAYLRIAAAEDSLGHGVFIDAICINQMDVAEKNSQIALMGSLYERACLVTVWFGDEGSWVPALVEKYPAIQDPAVLRSCLMREPPEPLTVQDAQEVRTTVHNHLVYHVYWSRVWTAQEYLLPDQLKMRAGVLIVDPQSIFDLVEYAPSESEPRNLMDFSHMRSARSAASFQSRRFGPICEHILTGLRCIDFVIGRVLYRERAPSEKRSIVHAIRYFSEQESSVSRDRIFGLLGLCRSGIVPDYNAPMIKLYIEALFEGLKEIRTLYVPHENLYVGMGIFIASLLSSLGLRLEHPAVFLVTQLALDPVSKERWRTTRLIFELNLDLTHPRLNDMLYNSDLLHLVIGLQFRSAMSTFTRVMVEDARVIGPGGESGTFAAWVYYVNQVLLELTESRERMHGRREEDEPMGMHDFWLWYVDHYDSLDGGQSPTDEGQSPMDEGQSPRAEGQPPTDEGGASPTLSQSK
ncbi:hypothetical protein LTR17_016620 [Elasticomyces elasticus]|nr:hypothetical protein LTR17_016620 [Elasticomyces elasticus]